MIEIQTALAGYAAARSTLQKTPDNDNDPAVRAIRVDLPALLRTALASRTNASAYKLKASVGERQLHMAAVPWVAIFHTNVTRGARHGYYVVLLFAEDGKSAVLSLNQGFSDFLDEYRSPARAAEKARAVAGFAAKILQVPPKFVSGPIDLQATTSLGRGYEQGAILSRVYTDPAALLEEDFLADVHVALNQYDRLHEVAGVSLLGLMPAQSNEDFQEAVQAEAKQGDLGLPTTGPQKPPVKVVRQGQGTYVRDPKVAARALAQAQYTCALSTKQAPHQTFTSRSSKREYVEAHHLIPMSRQPGFTASLDVEENVVPLCPLCHRMVHLGMASDRAPALIQLLGARSVGLNARGIEVTLGQLKQFYSVLADED